MDSYQPSRAVPNNRMNSKPSQSHNKIKLSWRQTTCFPATAGWKTTLQASAPLTFLELVINSLACNENIIKKGQTFIKIDFGLKTLILLVFLTPEEKAAQSGKEKIEFGAKNNNLCSIGLKKCWGCTREESQSKNLHILCWLKPSGQVQREFNALFVIFGHSPRKYCSNGVVRTLKSRKYWSNGVVRTF